MPIYPQDKFVPNGPFPQLEDIYIEGGYQIVADDTARDAILESRRKLRMLVRTLSDNKIWELVSLPNTWVEFSPGGGGSTISLLNQLWIDKNGDDDTGAISDPARPFASWMGDDGAGGGPGSGDGTINGAYKAVKDASILVSDKFRVNYGVGLWTGEILSVQVTDRDIEFSGTQADSYGTAIPLNTLLDDCSIDLIGGATVGFNDLNIVVDGGAGCYITMAYASGGAVNITRTNLAMNNSAVVNINTSLYFGVGSFFNTISVSGSTIGANAYIEVWPGSFIRTDGKFTVDPSAIILHYPFAITGFEQQNSFIESSPWVDIDWSGGIPFPASRLRGIPTAINDDDAVNKLEGVVDLANQCWVDKNGSDTTGQVGNLARPFVTIPAAITAIKAHSSSSEHYSIHLGTGLWEDDFTWDATDKSLNIVGLQDALGTVNPQTVELRCSVTIPNGYRGIGFKDLMVRINSGDTWDLGTHTDNIGTHFNCCYVYINGGDFLADDTVRLRRGVFNLADAGSTLQVAAGKYILIDGGQCFIAAGTFNLGGVYGNLWFAEHGTYENLVDPDYRPLGSFQDFSNGSYIEGVNDPIELHGAVSKQSLKKSEIIRAEPSSANALNGNFLFRYNADQLTMADTLKDLSRRAFDKTIYDLTNTNSVSIVEGSVIGAKRKFWHFEPASRYLSTPPLTFNPQEWSFWTWFYPTVHENYGPLIRMVGGTGVFLVVDGDTSADSVRAYLSDNSESAHVAVAGKRLNTLNLAVARFDGSDIYLDLWNPIDDWTTGSAAATGSMPSSLAFTTCYIGSTGSGSIRGYMSGANFVLADVGADFAQRYWDETHADYGFSATTEYADYLKTQNLAGGTHNLVATDSNTLFDTVGAATQVIVNLPATPDLGMVVEFFFFDPVATGLQINGNGRAVRDVGVAGASISTTTRGSTIRLACHSQTAWIVIAKNGTWTIP